MPTQQGRGSLAPPRALLAMGYTFGERAGSEATLIPQSKIQAAIEHLAHAARPVRILLFGSYARGTQRMPPTSTC